MNRKHATIIAAIAALYEIIEWIYAVLSDPAAGDELTRALDPMALKLEIAKAAKKVEAVYYTPFLAHATMEPMNCIARVTAGKAEAWVPTQNAESSLAALSEASGVPLANCEVYRTDPGGGFGRRGGAQDYVRQAVQIARQFPGVPIKMLWTREEDQGHDFFRPISMMKGEAGLDAQGHLVGLRIRISGQSINAWSNPGAIVGGKDERQLQGELIAGWAQAARELSDDPARVDRWTEQRLAQALLGQLTIVVGHEDIAAFCG